MPINRKVIETVLGKRLTDWLVLLRILFRKWRKYFGILFLRFISNSKVLSGIYYGLLSQGFRRENRAVIKGLIKYNENQRRSSNSSVLLRRNIHRLEKGIIMRPRRSVFAEAYIAETVIAYRRVLGVAATSGVDYNPEIQWASDVLTDYFQCVVLTGRIKKAHDDFVQCTPRIPYHGMVPYKRNLDLPSPVGYQNFYDLCVRRRSVRWFRQATVPRNLLDKAFEAAALSPSACNRQPFRFFVMDDRESLERIRDLPGGVKGFQDNIPVMVAIIGDLSAYFGDYDRHLIYIDGSLAAMSLMLALETLGLSSCSINWPDIEPSEKALEAVLDLPDHERVIMFVALGYPDPEGMVPRSIKKPIEKIREFAR